MRFRSAGLLALVTLVGGAIACDSAASSAGFDSSSPTGSSPNPGDNIGGDAGSGGASSGTPQAATASGVVLVHAAAFPPFRLCFANQLAKQPQPDRQVMPEANVVGVEQGSLIRLDPLDAPGTV